MNGIKWVGALVAIINFKNVLTHDLQGSDILIKYCGTRTSGVVGEKRSFLVNDSPDK